MRPPKLHIAFLGTRGVPASYSGFETFVEQLGVRLVERGHQVTVFNRYPFVPLRDREYRGMRIIRLRTIQRKSLDTLLHTFRSCLRLPFVRPDVVYICGVGNAIFCGMVRMMGIPVVINVDGEDWARKKWSGFAVKWLRASEAWACRLANVVDRGCQGDPGALPAHLPARDAAGAVRGECAAGGGGDGDAEEIRARAAEVCAICGADGAGEPGGPADRGVSRRAEVAGVRLAIVGDAPYSEEYKRELAALADDRVVFTGYAFMEQYRN